MPNYALKTIPLYLLLLGVAGFSYYQFSEYKPNSTSHSDIKGTVTQKADEFPYPKDYKILSTDENSEKRIITIETAHTPQEIQKFYRTVLLGKGWEVESEGDEGVFLVTKYKMTNNQAVTITSSIQEATDKTIVSIEIKKNS